MASRDADRDTASVRGTKDVFADLRYPDAVERQAKLRLAYALNQLLDDRKLPQAKAARVLGATQPKVSALRNYKLAGFSVERLMSLLTALDQDIEIVIRRNPPSRRSGPDQRRRSLKPVCRPSLWYRELRASRAVTQWRSLGTIRPAGSQRQLPPNDLLGSRIHSTWHSPLMIGSA